MGKLLKMPTRIAKMRLNSIYGKRAGRICKNPTCQDFFNDGTNYKFCIPCRLARAFRQMVWRNHQTKNKLCVHCIENAYYNKTNKTYEIRCEYHRKYHRKMSYNYFQRVLSAKPYYSGKVRVKNG